MIQRKQSLLLLLSVLLFISTYYFPFGNFNENALHSYKVLNAEGVEVEGINHYFFAIPLSIAATITMLSIFLYSNRQRQMNIVRITFILFAASFVLMALYIADTGKQFSGLEFKIGPSFFFPFASFFLNMLALRLIRKDDKRIKSVDRIR